MDGSVEWFSGDPDQNPTSLKGVETTGGKLEGFRTLRVAFEPDRNIPGGCDKDISNVLNGSADGHDGPRPVTHRPASASRSWSKVGDNGVDEGDEVSRPNRPPARPSSTWLWRTKRSSSPTPILVHRRKRLGDGRPQQDPITNEQGRAEFTWTYTSVRRVAMEECSTATGASSRITRADVYFAESTGQHHARSHVPRRPLKP